MPGAGLAFFHIAGAGGETDSTMRKCVPQPSAIAPARCHVSYCAWATQARFDGHAKVVWSICTSPRLFMSSSFSVPPCRVKAKRSPPSTSSSGLVSDGPGPPVASARWLAEDPRQLRCFNFNQRMNCKLVFDLATGALSPANEDALFLGTLWRQKCVGLHRLFFFLAVTS